MSKDSILGNMVCYVTPCIESIKYAETSNGESNNGHQSKSEAYTKMVSGSRRGRDIIKSLVQRPRRTFTKKQIEEHNLGIILIVMSSLFIFCQSFKIIPDMYEIFQCNRLGKYGGNCEMKGPVSIFKHRIYEKARQCLHAQNGI